MTPIQVPESVRGRLAEIATAIGRERGVAATFGEAVEHLLAEHPRRISCDEAHAGMSIYCLPDGTHPVKCCGGA